MRKKAILALAGLMLYSVFASAQMAEKTLVKSFNLEGNQVVMLDFDGKVDMKTWDNSTMRIQIKISLAESTESVLKALIASRRYDVFSKSENGELVLFTPGLEKKIQVGNRLLDEKIEYTVYVPGEVLLKQRETEAAEGDLTQEENKK